MADLVAAFGLVFLAELGDKSMLLAVAFAVKFRPVPVIAGIAIAAATMLGLSVLVGAAIATALPDGMLALIGGALFIGFGLWSLRPEDGDDDEEARVHSRFVLLTVTGSFLIAEFGDKTMLATITLAGTQAALPTWIGAAAGMTVASGFAVVVARFVGFRLPRRAIQLTAAGAFLLFGALLLYEGITA